MKKNSKISVALHALIHLSLSKEPRTSEYLAQCLGTNPVVVRRILGQLKKCDLVDSGKGHGGGWQILQKPEAISLFDVYSALNENLLPTAPEVDDQESCQIVRALADTMSEFLDEATELLNVKLKKVSLRDMMA